MNRKIGYARVSTQDQNPALQINALHKEGCNPIYKEKKSGIDENRSELKAALESLNPGDVLVVWKLDRLARSVKQLSEIVESVNEREAKFISITEKIDTTTPSGMFFLHVLVAMAEFECSLIRERINAGLKAARKAGRVGGRRHALSSEQRTALRRERAENPDMTYKELAKSYRVSERTIQRYLASHAR